MMWLAWLPGCGWFAHTPPDTGPNPQATAAVAKALCKLAQGASLPCQTTDTTAILDGHAVEVAAAFVEREEVLSQITFRGTITLRVSGEAQKTAWRGYGWGENEAIDRGVHEWALVSGTAFVDALLDPIGRPTLAAIEPELPQAIPTPVAQFEATRGWTLWRGADVTLDHAILFAHATPTLGKLHAKTTHTLQIRIQPDNGKQQFACHLDGTPSAALCDAVRAYSWPDGFGWTFATAYTLVPQRKRPAP